MVNQKQIPNEQLRESHWTRLFFRGIQILALTAVGLLIIAWPQVSQSQVLTAGISVTLAPPALPVYTQPPLPEDGYLWMPGYWAYGDDGYYWVPGVWVEPPVIGLLWTPGYWDWNGGIYVWQAGYWGPHVGFYGGVNYGFGYAGSGYAGGYWQNGALFYNRTVVNIGSVRVVNVYERPIPGGSAFATASFHGGRGGTTAVPTADEQAAARESHRPPTIVQVQQQRWAGTQRDLLTSVNHGKPAITATQRPAQRPDSSIASGRVGDRNNVAAPRPTDSRAMSATPKSRTGSDLIKSAPAIKLQDASAAQQRQQRSPQEQRPAGQEQKSILKQVPTREQRPVSADNSSRPQPRPAEQEQRSVVRQAPTREQRPVSAGNSSRPQPRPEERRASKEERPNSG